MNKNIARDIQKLEQLALMLDEGCGTKEIDIERVDKAQDILNDLSDEILKNKKLPGSTTYIIYEVQSLIYWVNGDKNKSLSLIKSAKKVKGDSNLFTSSARDLVKQAERVSSAQKNIFIGVIFLCIISFLFWLLVNTNNTIETLRNENSSLESDKNSLQNEVDGLNDEVNTLQDQLDKLKDEISDLNEADYYEATSAISDSIGQVCGPAPSIDDFLTEYQTWWNCAKTNIN